jgi:hypothetical protein
MSDSELILLGVIIGAVELSFVALLTYLIWQKRKDLDITYKKILR